MLKYNLRVDHPSSHYLSVKISFTLEEGQTTLVMPLWRPGRYEEAPYVKNIRNLSIVNDSGKKIDYIKSSQNTWKIHPGSRKIIITYDYFANQLDAGNSFVGNDFIVFNFNNFLIYPQGQEDTKCVLNVDLPEELQVTCAMNSEGTQYIAANFEELADKPLIAALKLSHFEYLVNNKNFHIWVAGENSNIVKELIDDFKKFSEAQVSSFYSVPFKDYHFYIVSPAYRFYHGVEHQDNTLIVLGVDDIQNQKQKFIDDLLGVSSHELFHVWNIKKIRPAQLKPYNFRDPIIFDTGWVAEGFTTYYGDLYLCRGGVWSIDRYLEEFNQFLDRHFSNTGRLNASLVTSSNNLWLDGYKQGPPHHKVSIYVKGAISALILDLSIRRHSQNMASLDDFMRDMDSEFTTNGYTIDQLFHLLKKYLPEEKISDYKNMFIYGTEPVEEHLPALISDFGLNLNRKPNPNPVKKTLGIILINENDKWSIYDIYPGSISDGNLSIGDEIESINSCPPDEFITGDRIIEQGKVDIKVMRLGKEKDVSLSTGKEEYYTLYHLSQIESQTEHERQNLEKWLNKKPD